jgi:adenine-specific DNA methylase
MNQRDLIEPILIAIPAARQEDARHYGVHPYFTRRPANVVRQYVEHYSLVGDTVLDPFGGTGVTAIEAFLLGRKAIQNDLNPFANFIACNIADTSLPSAAPLKQAFEKIEKACASDLAEIEKDEAFAQKLLKKLPLPENIRLPKNSDAELFYDMFTPRQLAGLALIKREIEKHSEGAVRDLLLLAWSASVAKLNKTFLSAKGRAESRGGSSIFSIYRYKLASQSVELPIWKTFQGRFENILAAKKEVLHLRDYHREQSGGKVSLDSGKSFRVLSHDAATLDKVIKPNSVDYIFTDPPYGAFISYLDLSILWNHWLGFPVTDETREQETIVGGEQKHSEDHYKQSLARSIETSFHLLKPDRWLSIVFQHWDISYFATILETASECGGELKAAITQTGDVIWSMHKKKNSASVLAGEMILTFYKPAKVSKSEPKAKSPDITNPTAILSEAFDSCLNHGATSFTNEALFNQLVMELWQRRALSCLSLDRDEFIEQLEKRGWIYNTRSHLWSKLGQGKSFIGEMMLFED